MATTTRQLPRPGLRKPNKPQAGPKARTQAPQNSDVSKGGWFGTMPATIIQYGPPGCGKTSMWAHAPDVGFLIDSKEKGILHLVDAGQCPEPVWIHQAEDFTDLMYQIARIVNKEVPIKNLVLDSLTGLELLCFLHHCNENFDGDWSKEGFLSFQQGPKNAAKTDWPKMLDALDLVNDSGINVIVLGHSDVKRTDNPEGPDYDTYVPIIDRATWAQTHRWAKAVFFQNFDITLQLKSKGSTKKIASGGEARMLYTQNSAAYIAKNLWGLPPVIDLGSDPKTSYESFMAAYKSARKK